MNHGPDFLGLGVEKAGTSWIFACLYEHSEICIPRKEVNFFSDAALWANGRQWYEAYFEKRCNFKKVKGEYSTAYLYDTQTAERIHDLYPETRLIVCLRDPIDRAVSGYLNAVKAGTIPKNTNFEQAISTDKNYLLQGKYKIQLERYLSYFAPSQMLILIYEDIVTDPQEFIQGIYRFLQVDEQFVPPSLYERINTARVPNNVQIEKWSNSIAHYLQKSKLGEKIWWLIKQSKIPERIRQLNTTKNSEPPISKATFNKLKEFYQEDLIYVESLLNRKLNWLRG